MMVECWGIAWGPLTRRTEHLPGGRQIDGELEHGYEFPNGQGIIADSDGDLRLLTRRWSKCGIVGIQLYRAGRGRVFCTLKRQSDVIQEPRLLIREIDRQA